MTGPLRDRLAEALPGSVGPALLRYPTSWGGNDAGKPTGFGAQILDALLPEVRAYVAEQLRAAAARIDGSRRWDTQIARDLRQRADQLDGGRG